MLVLLLIGAAGVLLSLISFRGIAIGVLQIMALVAGACFFAGFALLLDLVRQPRSAPFIQVTFNERELLQDLEGIIEAEFVEVPDRPQEPWESAEALIAEDPVLALAKVRIDLEREVRQRALDADLVRPDQRLTMSRALDALQRKGALPKAVVTAIHEILPVCNRAIHGEVVDVSTVRQVIDVAREVMVILRGMKYRNYI